MSVKTLLDFIAKPESGGDYNIVWGGIKKQHRPPRPLVEMTIGQVLAWQDSIDPIYMSEAAGRYQIMEDTLRGLYAEAGMSLNDLFDKDGQDKLAIHLLKRRGLKKYQQGLISANTFANNLAHEWASLPMVTGPNVGRSVYAGDGLNKSHVSVQAFLKAVQAVKSGDLAPQIIDAVPPVNKPSKPGFWATLFAAIAAIFRRKA